MTEPIVDAHVHFWDPAELEYPWLEGIPALRRAFLPGDYSRAMDGVPVERLVFVECNARADQGLREVEFVERLAAEEPRIAGIVAYLDLPDAFDGGRVAEALDALAAFPLVKGVRHNIQGHAPGYCLQPAFVAGVREAGRRGLCFDLCATHDQLADVVALARQVPQTRLVLDHCGKPGIRAAALGPWATHVRELAALPNVWCKLSGLLTEADTTAWREADLVPFAEEVVRCFGVGRMMYGSDWPVLTLAERSAGWYPFTRSFTAGWSEADRRRFYWENAHEFYRL